MEVGKLTVSLAPRPARVRPPSCAQQARSPGVCYGASPTGKIEPMPIVVDVKALRAALDPVRKQNTVIDLTIEGGREPTKLHALVKDYQIDVDPPRHHARRPARDRSGQGSPRGGAARVHRQAGRRDRRRSDPHRAARAVGSRQAERHSRQALGRRLAARDRRRHPRLGDHPARRRHQCHQPRSRGRDLREAGRGGDRGRRGSGRGRRCRCYSGRGRCSAAGAAAGAAPAAGAKPDAKGAAPAAGKAAPAASPPRRSDRGERARVTCTFSLTSFLSDARLP